MRDRLEKILKDAGAVDLEQARLQAIGVRESCDSFEEAVAQIKRDMPHLFRGEGIDDPQQLRAQRDELLNVLIEALPYVEMAEHDEAYKPGTVKKMANKMRKAIAHATPEPASK